MLSPALDRPLTPRDTDAMRMLRGGAVMSLMTLAVAAVASGAATGLGGGGGDSGVRGRVVPCGIVLERAAPCATGAEPISIVVEQGDRVVHREKVREGGSYRVRLEAGRY